MKGHSVTDHDFCFTEGKRVEDLHGAMIYSLKTQACCKFGSVSDPSEIDQMSASYFQGPLSNPFRTTRFLPVQKLSFFQILLPLGYKTICRCPHVNTTCSFQDIFGDTGVPMILKGNKPCLCNNGI